MWPSILPIIGRLSPSARAQEAKELGAIVQTHIFQPGALADELPRIVEIARRPALDPVRNDLENQRVHDNQGAHNAWCFQHPNHVQRETDGTPAAIIALRVCQPPQSWSPAAAPPTHRDPTCDSALGSQNGGTPDPHRSHDSHRACGARGRDSLPHGAYPEIRSRVRACCLLSRVRTAPGRRATRALRHRWTQPRPHRMPGSPSPHRPHRSRRLRRTSQIRFPEPTKVANVAPAAGDFKKIRLRISIGRAASPPHCALARDPLRTTHHSRQPITRRPNQNDAARYLRTNSRICEEAMCNRSGRPC